jgi:TRAP transporter TAXI family solute receptor
MLERLNLFFLILLTLILCGVGGYLYFEAVRESHLVIAAGARNSEGFRLIEAIAEVVNRHDSRIELEVIETAGSLDNSRLIDEGYADLATLQADGTKSLSGRLIANLYPGAYHLIVRRDAQVAHIADLKNKTIALPSKGSSQHTSFWFLASHYGITESNVTALPMSNRAAEWALISGAVDAVFRVRAPGDASVKQLIERADISLVPINQAPAMHLSRLAIQPGMIPMGSYRGDPPLPRQDLATASVEELLVASADLPSKIVYRIAAVLFERRRELAEINALASMIRAPELSSGTHLPLHEGALNYYDREKPTFWNEQADFLRTLISLLAVFGSMIFALRNWLLSAQKNRADAYNKDLISLYETSKKESRPVEIYRDELARILTQVVDDLDNDRISREGFNEFSFTWQAVSQLLNDDSARSVPNSRSAEEPAR